MSTLFQKISEKVGYAKRNVAWPTTAQVREALERKSEQDIFNLLLWYRNLKDPQTPRQEKIINLIDDGLTNMTI